MSATWRAWRAYRLRWKRRYFLWRSYRKQSQMRSVANNTAAIQPDDILLFCTLRNEAARLPWFLDYHRALGVQHFLIVDNGSDDGTADLLRNAPDVSVWHTTHSYKASRFGVDWLTSLQMRFGHGHWCLTLDADELLVYPHHDTIPLDGLTQALDARGQNAMRVVMLDLFPKGALSAQSYQPGTDPLTHLHWFDADNFTQHDRPELQTRLTRGGARARAFFASDRARAPTMNKIPLVKWNRRYAYIDSTHSALPTRLNRAWDTAEAPKITGALLHTKFLDMIVEKSAEEQCRQEHFSNSLLYNDYYDALIEDPDLWHDGAEQYRDWQQLQTLGLLSTGGWKPLL